MSARVLYPSPSGDWIDADGEAVDVENPARMVTKVFGPDGSVVAAIDTARQRAVHPGLVEVAAATVLSSLQNDKAQAEANSRLTELHALQLELVNGTDDSRKSLESDLHDGAQQRLVGLSLAARLSARSGDSEAVRQQLASQLRLARQDVLALLESGVPVPLRARAGRRPAHLGCHERGPNRAQGGRGPGPGRPIGEGLVDAGVRSCRQRREAFGSFTSAHRARGRARGSDPAGER